MFVKSTPDALTKLSQLGDTTHFEPSGDQPQVEHKRVPYQSSSLEECITNVVTPTGKKPILKTMMTTACERNCFYCPFRAGRRKTQRTTFSSDEMASAFDTLYRATRVDGIFLSSGIIKGSVTTQDRIIDTIDIIRHIENLTPSDPLREHRLYQASFLLRDYDWSVEDLSFLEDGNLRVDIDPKRAWAERNLREAPIDVMKATRRQLLRVPGIGPVGAEAIIRARKLGELTDLAHLRKLHIHAPEHAAPYILLAGRRPMQQMSLF